MRRSQLFSIGFLGAFLCNACGGSSGSPPPLPTVTILASPSVVTVGQSVGLTWSTTNTTSCTSSASPSESDWSGLQATNGSKSVSPLSAGTINYTLMCTGAGGSGSGAASVTAKNASATHFSISAPSTATAGTAFNFTVTAFDASNNPVSDYAGTVHFSSSDSKATLPQNSTLTNGTGTFPATLGTAGSQTITATDTATASITGTSNSINVSVVTATHFSVSAPSTAMVGTAFNFTVAALDASNNPVSSYTGTVHFTSSDSKADLPVNSTLANGIGTFPAGLKTAGGRTITATDTATASITGTSSVINVSLVALTNPVPLVNEPLSPAATVPGSEGFTLTVNGTGFVPGSVVKWDGSARATSFVSQSRVTANVMAADVVNFHTARVSVVNPSPGGGTSNEVYFEVTRPTSAVAMNTPIPFATGSGPSSVVTPDFNGDGKLDLAVANSGSNNISILLGNGDGTFQPALNQSAGSGPASMAVGDFNGDGKLDLAVANSGSNNVSVFLGKGDGTFQSAVDYAADASPTWIAAGDFNGDGKLDLAVANRLSNDVSVFLGKGDGTFEPALNTVVAGAPFALAVGDFNGDGKLDLFAATFAAQAVSVLLGNGDGTFQPVASYAAGGAVSAVVGDFNGDGKLDVALGIIPSGNMGPTNVSVLLGNGDGTFQPAVDYSVGSNAYVSSVLVGMEDLNGDGKLDLTVAIYGGEDIFSLLLNKGDGTFQPAVNFPAGSEPVAMAPGDFNNDGRLDMAVGNGSSSMVSVLLQPALVSGPSAITSPSSLAYPSQLVGTSSAPQPVQVVNYGTMPLNITSISAPANFNETDDCKSSVAPGASCTVNVTFAPSVSGNLSGMLLIADNAPGSPRTVSLSGVATVVTLSANSLRFGCILVFIPRGPECLCSRPQTLTLTNTANSALSITAINITGPFSENNNCPSSLGAGQSCTITVQWARVTGNGTLLITDSGGGSPQSVFLDGFVQCNPSVASGMATASSAMACGGQ